MITDVLSAFIFVLAATKANEWSTEDFDIVIPKQVNFLNKFSAIKKLTKRSLKSVPDLPTDRIFVVLNARSKNLYLNLTANSKLVTKNTIIEWVLENGERVIRNATSASNCFYVGREMSAEDTGKRSLVAINSCDGITGYIETDDEFYFIEPIRSNGGSKLSTVFEQFIKGKPELQHFYNNLWTKLNKSPAEEQESSYNKTREAVMQPHVIYKVQSLAKMVRLSLSKDIDANHSRSRRSVDKIKRKKEERIKRCKHLLEKDSNDKNEAKAQKRCLNKAKRTARSDKRKRRERKKKKKRKKHKKKQESQDDIPKGYADPYKGEEVDGYSPDLIWESDVAAATSGLLEVTIGSLTDNESADSPKWIELVVASDHTVVEFHGEDAEKYVMTLFNIVSAIYEDPSLSANIGIVLQRMIFYKDKRYSQVKKGLAKKSLEAVNRWAERLYNASAPNIRQDLSVWLTRYELGGPSGYAPVSGVCDPSRSCTLNRDEGLTSAFIIAHEMGHVLGLTHDGDISVQNKCENEGLLGSVMAPLVAATFNRFHWSHCSRKEYHEKAKNWTCLLNRPEGVNTTMVSSSVQFQFTLDDQCRMEFGSGFALCLTMPTLRDPCMFLWCANSSTPELCKTKKGPPLEGTVCGPAMRCRNGFCERVRNKVSSTVTNESSKPPVRHNPQHGSWGTWSDWGSCSRTCGTGVAFRVRKCDNPEPLWGGKRCSGRTEDWKVCSSEECPVVRDFRAEQCSKVQELTILDDRRQKLHWQPYLSKSRRKMCRLLCFSEETNEVYLGKEYLIDGTPCSYNDAHDICVQGKCIPLGCDKMVRSKIKDDQCGVCGGSGEECQKIKRIFRGILKKGYTDIAELPLGARQIQIRETQPTKSFLALRGGTFGSSLNANGLQEPEHQFIKSGALFTYYHRGDREELTAVGPILETLTLMVYGVGGDDEMEVTLSFDVQIKRTFYKLEVGDMTPCSVTCGGGTHQETLICRDLQSDLEVSNDFCLDLVKPRLQSKICNDFGCETRWVTGRWESCSATCGSLGVQQRVASCIRVRESEQEDMFDNFIHPSQCAGQSKPVEIRPCNRDICPGQWLPHGWTECSTTCGPGLQKRLWRCMRNKGESNDIAVDCGPKPVEIKKCLKGPCQTTLSLPCTEDQSPFCQIPDLHRYCQIPKFYGMCCVTCMVVS